MQIFSFTGQNQQDPTYQMGLQQYAQQGQSMINPGQAQIAASNPVSFGARQGFGDALAAAAQNGPPAMQQLPMPVAQKAMEQGAQMGSAGPTVQHLMLAKQLMQGNNG